RSAKNCRHPGFCVHVAATGPADEGFVPQVVGVERMAMGYGPQIAVHNSNACVSGCNTLQIVRLPNTD
ncbi:hypothetical protein, partial [Paratractidigestivibacter sp.]|uniref:hypothetical protein n=1 Tax=Paratractidigestivibacter sp. TaxID=2847316 RepID=UPI002AC92831